VQHKVITLVIHFTVKERLEYYFQVEV